MYVTQGQPSLSSHKPYLVINKMNLGIIKEMRIILIVFTLKRKYFAKPNFHKVVYNFEFFLQLCEVSMETV